MPQTNGFPLCDAPTGFGTQYSSCVSRADCADIYECVQTPYLTTYCMQWCTSSFDCSIFDSCSFFAPPIYVGGTEWGACWDGLP